MNEFLDICKQKQFLKNSELLTNLGISYNFSNAITIRLAIPMAASPAPWNKNVWSVNEVLVALNAARVVTICENLMLLPFESCNSTTVFAPLKPEVCTFSANFFMVHCDWLLLQAANVLTLANYSFFMPKVYGLYLKKVSIQKRKIWWCNAMMVNCNDNLTLLRLVSYCQLTSSSQWGGKEQYRKWFEL